MRYVRIILPIIFLATIIGCEDASNDATGRESTGQAGSMTRYTIQGNYLYVVTDRSLKTYLVLNETFSELETQELGFGLETIFSTPGYLYLGANDGMYIYDISNPSRPEFVFRYAHILACDPVVVQGNRAYITLRSDANACGRSVNELQIVDITDRHNPHLIINYPMESPRGLAVDGSYLFLCEGPAGLKVFDISNELNIQELQHLESIHSYDVIARTGRLTVTGEDGIFQFQYPSGGASPLKLLSKITVNRQ
jgi:hypothetical protein